MAPTITVVRYESPIWNEGVIPKEDQEITVHTIEPTEDDIAVTEAVGLLSGEDWQPSTLPLTAFTHMDWIHAEYLQSDQETEDVVLARFSADWRLDDMREVVKRVMI